MFTWDEEHSDHPTECKWMVELVRTEGGIPNLLSLKHVKTGKYLGCDGTNLRLSDEPETWGLIPAKGAPSPTQAVLGAVGGVVAVGAAVATVGTSLAASSALYAAAEAGVVMSAVGGEAFAASAAVGLAVAVGVPGGFFAIGGAGLAIVSACAPADSKALYVGM